MFEKKKITEEQKFEEHGTAAEAPLDDVAERRNEPGSHVPVRQISKALEIRRNRMARRLDKIEKEMGYCEVKLEKERRLRKQAEFLHTELDELEGSIVTNTRAARSTVTARRESGVRFARPTRGSFVAEGLRDILEEEREIFSRELKELRGRLDSFGSFEAKRTVLEEEKRSTLKDLAPAHSGRLRRVNEEFKRAERQWNTLSEDVMNLDEAIFFLERNLDYLRSCRTFLISAKGTFDIEAWVDGGYLAELFRHSSIGRAKEMADGADRNLKLALKELVCVSNARIKLDSFLKVLMPLLEALYEDIFVEHKLQTSLQVVEAALAGNIKAVSQVKAKREQWGAKLDEAEKARAEQFSRLGTDQRGWSDDDDE